MYNCFNDVIVKMQLESVQNVRDITRELTPYFRQGSEQLLLNELTRRFSVRSGRYYMECESSLFLWQHKHEICSVELLLLNTSKLIFHHSSKLKCICSFTEMKLKKKIQKECSNNTGKLNIKSKYCKCQTVSSFNRRYLKKITKVHIVPCLVLKKQEGYYKQKRKNIYCKNL